MRDDRWADASKAAWEAAGIVRAAAAQADVPTAAEVPQDGSRWPEGWALGDAGRP
jgi:hypothetical protein